MAQLLKVLAVLSEDLGSIPSTHMAAHNQFQETDTSSCTRQSCTHMQEKGFLSAIQMSTLVFCVQSIVLCSRDHILLGISGS